MKTKKSEPVGVIVGRFQSPYLHEAHLELIDTVCEAHPKVIIFLGLSPLRGTQENPLDYQAREQMIREKYPNVIVQYIKDVRDDKIWSAKLDAQIDDLITPNQTVRLYGSRDSFIPNYYGKYPTEELTSSRVMAASDIRDIARSRSLNTEGFRAGVIWATGNKYPTVYPTVDVAIFNEEGDKLLLAKKPHEKLYRFVGGFSSPNSPSFEIDAVREAEEETTLVVGDVKYVCSMIVDDWRYKREKDKIKTILFTAKVVSGGARPQDDIAEVRWFEYNKVTANDIVEEHRPLLVELKKNVVGTKITA